MSTLNRNAEMLNKIFAAPKFIISLGSNVVRNSPDIYLKRPQPVSYDMLFKDPKDGCALYDDVWGG